jgi:hypothetical protein
LKKLTKNLAMSPSPLGSWLGGVGAAILTTPQAGTVVGAKRLNCHRPPAAGTHTVLIFS